MVSLIQDNSGDDQNALFVRGDVLATHSVRIQNAANTCEVYLGSQSSSSGSSIFARNLASAITAGPVVEMKQQNAGDDQAVLRISQGVTTVEAIDFSAGTIAFDFAAAMATSGAGTMAVNNSPGAGATTWILSKVNGTAGYVPFHYAA